MQGSEQLHLFSTMADLHTCFQSIIIQTNSEDPQGRMLGPPPVRLSPLKSDKYQQRQLPISPVVPNLSVTDAPHQPLAVKCKCN